MRILIVSQYFWPESFRVNDIASGLIDLGHEVTVLTGKPNYPQGRFYSGYGVFSMPKEAHEGINIIRVPILPRGKSGILKLALNYISFAVSASLIGPFKCKGRYDCILVYQMSPVIQGIPAIVLKKIYKSPVFFWVQDLWPESLSAVGVVKKKWLLSFLEMIVGWLYRSSDKVLIQSEAFNQHVLQHSVNKNDIYYFPNSAEDLYKPVAPDCTKDIAEIIPNGFIVMFAGNVGIAQDMRNLLKAAELIKSNKNIHWVIVGDGRKYGWLKEEIHKRKLSDTVHCLGRYPVEMMPQFFSYADVMLVSLTKDPIFSSTIPAKIQSYMACGKPIIAALDGIGAEVVIKAKAGMVSEAENADKLSHVVVEMASMHQTKLAEMGRNALSYYNSNFDRKMLLNRLVSWIAKNKKAQR